MTGIFKYEIMFIFSYCKSLLLACTLLLPWEHILVKELFIDKEEITLFFLIIFFFSLSLFLFFSLLPSMLFVFSVTYFFPWSTTQLRGRQALQQHGRQSFLPFFTEKEGRLKVYSSGKTQIRSEIFTKRKGW